MNPAKEFGLRALPARQAQVARLVVDGMPSKIIADRLGISMRTVEKHRALIYRKMGVNSSVGLTRKFCVGANAENTFKDPALNNQENQIANLLVHDKMTKEIAAELGLSERTIEKHRRKIFDKTGVLDAIGLTRKFYGLCDLDSAPEPEKLTAFPIPDGFHKAI